MWLYFRWNVCVIICQSQGQLIDILCSTQIKYFYEEGTQHHQCTAKLDARIGSYIDNPWPKSYLYVGEICKKWSENTSKIVKILLVKEFWQIYRFLCPHPFFSKLHSAVLWVVIKYLDLVTEWSNRWSQPSLSPSSQPSQLNSYNNSDAL